MSEPQHIGRAPYNTPTTLEVCKAPDKQTLRVCGEWYAKLDIRRDKGVVSLATWRNDRGDDGMYVDLDDGAIDRLVVALAMAKDESKRWRRENQ